VGAPEATDQVASCRTSPSTSSPPPIA
jgi:hypothetical protein